MTLDVSKVNATKRIQSNFVKIESASKTSSFFTSPANNGFTQVELNFLKLDWVRKQMQATVKQYPYPKWVRPASAVLAVCIPKYAVASNLFSTDTYGNLVPDDNEAKAYT